MAEFRDEDGTTRLRGDFSGPIVVPDGENLFIDGTGGNHDVSFTAAGGDIGSISLVARDGGNFASVGIVGTDQRVNLFALAVVWRFANAAPADAALANGGFALWLDQTNGAGKLMVKAKTADGTVVTGSLNLT